MVIESDKKEIFFFKIESKNCANLYLNSLNQEMIFQSVKYLPYSGLSVLGIELNDSAQNMIFLHGIFEELGINQSTDFLHSKWKIIWAKGEVIHQIFNCYVDNITVKDLEFFITLKSEIFKYQAPLLKVFSKSCRTDLGSRKCGVNLQKYSTFVNILEVKEPNIIVIDRKFDPTEDKYFQNGKILIKRSTNNFSISKYLIVDYSNNLIEVDKNVDFTIESLATFLSPKNIKTNSILIPGCDKSFNSCCNMYNNSANFRGEPFIPKSKISKSF